MNTLQSVRVVLVATSHSGNIGAAARAIKNMGFSQLVLVAPKSFPSSDATSRAAGADDILEQATVVNNLEEALVGCTLVLGTSARDRHIPWPVLDPREAGELAVTTIEQGAEVALVFGRERTGLTNEELQQCHYHIHIPSDDEFSSLNVAAAVQVVTYEVRMAWLKLQNQPTKMEKKESTLEYNLLPCTNDELEQYYQHLEQTLIKINYLHIDNPGNLMARLRRLYGRSQITKLEMNILRGILTKTCYAIDHKTK